MAILTDVPTPATRALFKGVLVLYSVRGQVRARQWPRKYRPRFK